ncbi:MAG TPA: gamma-glutamylcyclotransferase [Firmicutes bacterium]|nr:gamma-glutamylcyclotransferase [Bacillota bacterium]
MDNEQGRIYLAYGSNLNLGQMERRCPAATVLGPAELKDYRLTFRGSDGQAVATIEEEKGKSVPVLLWHITPEDEEALDVYEGYPRKYIKKMLRVFFQGEWVEAMAYVMNDGWSLGMPGEGYLHTIREGYEAFGFDQSILEEAVEYSSSDI